MKNFMNSIKNASLSFAREEEGAQVIEYALIIAVVSIALVIALSAVAGTDFDGFIGRVRTCLTGAVGACV